MPRRVYHIAALLMVSGMCALVYQVAWLRELRVVFGASTPASAAVLAVFMGGLGLGSSWLGARADRARRPLALYAHLELGIAGLAAVTPLLLLVTRELYVLLGGSTLLGAIPSTVVRLLLSAVVLLPPTVLMGGTLPAAAKAALPGGDESRRSTAWLYGANALGALVGAGLSTFVLLEIFGARLTLWIGCLVNLLVGMTARMLDRSSSEPPASSKKEVARVGGDDKPARAPGDEARRGRMGARGWLLLSAAGAVGFAFLVMELVWYRVLSPLLGGSTYTFGLILAVALGGIGIGGVAYTRRTARPRLTTFAWTCALEALFLAVPYALGDRLAYLAIVLRPLGVAGLGGQVLGWTVVTAIVVLPAAIVSGYQFPALIGLLGRGGRGLGREVGLAYACNTFGAIAGSLAAGFVLMPLVGALGAWRLSAGLLLLLAVGAIALGMVRPYADTDQSRASEAGGQTSLRQLVGPVLTVALACAAIVLPRGPTAFWRHRPIGAGRADTLLAGLDRNGLELAARADRWSVRWEVDGRESSVALASATDTSFLVNGKSDGAVLTDSGTQVMSGLLGPLLSPQVKNALVIGLGTGATAGWLGAVDEVDRVDVVEIEPAILRVARDCAAANQSVLDNPKVRVHIGDAREVLLTTRDQYDLVFSEPSNPFRAGIASLFTREFYEAVRRRLRSGGLFVQWVQAYEIDARTLASVVSTLRTTFPVVSAWTSNPGDLLLVAGGEERPLDIARLRTLVATEPFRSALIGTWRVDSAEGVLAHLVGNAAFTEAVASEAGPSAVNTDDLNLLEYGLARTLGSSRLFTVDDIRRLAAARGEDRPPVQGEVDWQKVRDAFMASGLLGPKPRPHELPGMGSEETLRFQALGAWARGDFGGAIEAWSGQTKRPEEPGEILAMADSLVAAGRPEASGIIDHLSTRLPTEAALLRAFFYGSRSEFEEATTAAVAAIERLRIDPYGQPALVDRLLALCGRLARSDAARLRMLSDALAEPFAADLYRYDRLRTRFDIAMLDADPAPCAEALVAFEPEVPWEHAFLLQRLQCYQRGEHPLAARARAELNRYVEDAGSRASDLVTVPEQGEAPAGAP